MTRLLAAARGTEPVRLIALCLALLALAAPPADAQQIPRFDAYPAAEAYTGETAEPDLSDPVANQYRTRLIIASRRGVVNAAGRYILVTWGCGSICTHGGLYDAVDGSFHLLPATICCNRATSPDFRAVETRADSRLIILAGELDHQPPMGAHFFEFRDEQFVPVTTIPDDGTFQ